MTRDIVLTNGTLAPSLHWEVRAAEDCREVVFAGEIDEFTELSALIPELRGQVRFDLQGITRINSSGLRTWVNFIRCACGHAQVTLARCSRPIVDQLNMIYNFRGSAAIESFYAPYICEQCQLETEKLLDVSEQVRAGKVLPPPSVKCPECGSPQEFDDLPERYLQFLSML
jgi:ABC-type transporter Mla MlaB component